MIRVVFQLIVENTSLDLMQGLELQHNGLKVLVADGGVEETISSLDFSSEFIKISRG